MYILKVNDGDRILTYTFQNTNSGKSGDDGTGLHIFISALKKYYYSAVLPASMTIMDENGLYYNEKLNLYISEKTVIKLSGKKTFP